MSITRVLLATYDGEITGQLENEEQGIFSSLVSALAKLIETVSIAPQFIMTTKTSYW